jgi:hypothetical protein
VEGSGLSRGPPAPRLLARGQAASLNTRLGGLGLAVAAFLVLRITTLMTSLETVSVDEELHRGTIARELGVGLKVPLWDHLADPYSGGSLIVGLAAAPLFLALGPRLIVLKLVPLGISLLTLVLLMMLLDRYHSRRAAWVGATLFVLAPPFTTQLAFLAMGYHTESIVFSALLMLCWVRALEHPERRGPFWLGLVAGFAFSFTYITALTSLGCLVCSRALLRRAGRPLGKLTVGLAVGLVPWAAYNLTHRFDGPRAALVWFTPADGSPGSPLDLVLRAGQRLAAVLALGMPLSYGFPAMLGLPGPVWSFGYWATTLVFVTWLLFRARTRPSLVRPLLVSVILFVLVYPLTRFGVPTAGTAEDFRLFLPVQFALLATAAIALAEAPFGTAGAAVLIVVGALGQATLPGRDLAPHFADYRGYSYFVFGRAWHDRIDPVRPEAQPLLARLDERDARLVYWGAVDAEPAQWATPSAPQRVGEVPVAFRPYFAAAVGRAVGQGRTGFTPLVATIDAIPRDVQEHFTLGYGLELSTASDTRMPDVASLVELPADLRPWCHFGIGGLLQRACIAGPDHPPCSTGWADVQALDPDAGPSLYRGAGSAAAGLWMAGRPTDPTRIGPHVVPPERRGDFAWGLGWGIREAFKEDLVRTQDWLSRLRPSDREAALAGVRAYDRLYRLDDRR